MTREDRLLVRGMEDAEKGFPPDRYDDPLYREGYDRWMEVIRRRRLRKVIENIKPAFQTRRH